MKDKSRVENLKLSEHNKNHQNKKIIKILID